MGMNVTDAIVWEDDGTWWSKRELFGGDFFWYEVDPQWESTEFRLDFGELFLNGEGIAVAIVDKLIPVGQNFGTPIRKRP